MELDSLTEHDHYDATFPRHLESLPPLQRRDVTERCRAENQIRSSDAGVVIHGGEGYTVYSSQDILGEVGETYGRLLDVVAAWCGVTIEDVLRVTEAFERRLAWNVEHGSNVGQRQRQQQGTQGTLDGRAADE